MRVGGVCARDQIAGDEAGTNLRVLRRARNGAARPRCKVGSIIVVETRVSRPGAGAPAREFAGISRATTPAVRARTLRALSRSRRRNEYKWIGDSAAPRAARNTAIDTGHDLTNVDDTAGVTGVLR